MRQEYEDYEIPFMDHSFLWYDSSSEEDESELPAVLRTLPYRTPFGFVDELDGTRPITNLNKHGVTPTQDYAITPQSSRSFQLNWMNINHSSIPKQQLRANEPRILRIYWLISNKQFAFVYPLVDDNDNKYDYHFKSWVGSLFPSITLHQDQDGTWSLPTSGTGTTTFTIDTPAYSITLTDDHTSRTNDSAVIYNFTWTSNENQIVHYMLTKAYDMSAVIRTLKTVTLPSDCLIFHDQKNHPGTPSTALGATANGAPEAFSSGTDSISIDRRDLTVWAPLNHQNLQVLVPAWLTPAQPTANVSVTLANETDAPLQVWLKSQTITIASGSFGSISDTFSEATMNTTMRRSFNPLFHTNNGKGTIPLLSYTTNIPLQVDRTVYQIKNLIYKAYTLNTVTSAVTEIPDLNTLFTNPTITYFESSPTNNQNVIIECRLWFHRWRTFGGLATFTTMPPVNLGFNGDMRVSDTLVKIQNQMTTPATSSLYRNPYQSDPGKTGIISMGTGYSGELVNLQNNVITFFISRDIKNNGSLLLSRVITLN